MKINNIMTMFLTFTLVAAAPIFPLSHVNEVESAVATPAQVIQVGNVEELYAAVNDSRNAGATLTLASGVYMLSETDLAGVGRANGGRLDLLENMSLMGVEGDRNAVVIDAINLPSSSYRVPIVVAAVRLGRGRNSIEWLTVRNAVNGMANIDTTLQWQGTAFVRIAHVASTGGQRGLDVRNAGDLGASGETIDAEFVDNDFFNNNRGALNQGLRIVNLRTGPGTVINARMIGNRFWGQHMGRVLANNGSTNSTVHVFSSGNRAFGNGAGTVIIGANAGAPANGNAIDLQAHGDHFVDNTATPFPDLGGGLVVLGGDNVSLSANVVNNNTVHVSLWGCRIEGNGTWDIFAVGARSIPESVGAPGVNNHVTIEINGEGRGRWEPVEFFADSIPHDPSLNNSVTVIR